MLILIFIEIRETQKYTVFVFDSNYFNQNCAMYGGFDRYVLLVVCINFEFQVEVLLVSWVQINALFIYCKLIIISNIFALSRK